MKRLTEDIVRFFRNENFVIVSTIGKDEGAHSSCKGIVDIDPDGRIYLLDLYKARTYENLKRNSHISITAVNEHRFRGYCLKGRAGIVRPPKLPPHILSAWEKRITGRISQRIIKNIHGEKGHPSHPEALLPKPEYLIVMETEEVINLSPQKQKEA